LLTGFSQVVAPAVLAPQWAMAPRGTAKEGGDKKELASKRGGEVVQIDESPAGQLLDVAAADEAVAREAARQALSRRGEVRRAAEEHWAAEREARNREFIAQRSAEQAERMRNEAERLRREAEKTRWEAEQAEQRCRAAQQEAQAQKVEVQKCRELEVKLKTEAEDLQVVAETAAAKAHTTMEKAAAAAAEELFGRPVGPDMLEALGMHPAEEVYSYPGKEEAAHAHFVLVRPGSQRASGTRAAWGTSPSLPEEIVQPPSRASVIVTVDERLVVAVLWGLLQGTGREAPSSDRVWDRLPTAILQEVADAFQRRDADAFRAALSRLCRSPVVKADTLVGSEIVRCGLWDALDSLIEADPDDAREFIQETFPEDVLRAGEELTEKLEQVRSEQGIVEYRQQKQQQAIMPRRQPRSLRPARMHRTPDTTVYSVVHMPEYEDGWDDGKNTLYISGCDVLTGAREAVEDHLAAVRGGPRPH